jgi:hypothetical protein
MRQLKISGLICALFSGVLIMACAGTKLTQTWVDEAHRGKPVSDILVIAITYKEEVRHSYEDKFVAQLKALGIDAVSSADVIPIPADLKLEKDQILNVVKNFENDAVIITHMGGVEEKETYSPSTKNYTGFYGYYDGLHTLQSSPSFYTSHTLVRLVTNLYDVETEKLIWSGQSETKDPRSIDQTIDDVINLVIKDMQKKGLLSPK